MTSIKTPDIIMYALYVSGQLSWLDNTHTHNLA